MLLFQLIVAIYSCSATQAAQHPYALSEWFSYPINDLNDASVQQIIVNSIESLSINGMFHIPNFLSNDGLSLFQQKMTSIQHKRNRQQRTKNVFQDLGDLNNFDSKHPRNYINTFLIGFVGRNSLSKEFISFYEYEPLLDFFKQILLNAHHLNNDTFDCQTYTDLYLSAAEEGSVYAYIAQNGDSGQWHFDQHPFSCVWMISKPQKGGQLKYKYTPPIKGDSNANYYDKKVGYDWQKLSKIIIEDNEEYFHRLSANEGDVYCFKGNITVHMAEHVFGEKLRSVLVTTFADYPNFNHIPEIDKVNDWGQNKHEL